MNPKLYRKRIIPNECIHLKEDIIIFQDESLIITKWNALKPKKELHHGFSCYFLKEGYKVSSFFCKDNSLLYWYCDIVEYEFDYTNNALIVTDLLADVIIYPNGFVKVMDLDEMITALEHNGLSIRQLKYALLSLNNLLQIIYENKFNLLKEPIERFF